MTATTVPNPSSSSASFQSLEGLEGRLIRASAAQNMGGFTVRQDFLPDIEYYLRKKTQLWQMIKNKRYAKSAIIRRMREGVLPKVGWLNRSNLGSDLGENRNTLPDTQTDLSDPGQEVKAIGGTIVDSHFERSLQSQQGFPYGNTFAEETKDLLVSMGRHIEMSLFTGNAQTNPLEFNGIHNQMRETPDHVIEVDITQTEPDSIIDTIIETVLRAKTDRNILRDITHIFCTGASSLMIQREIGQVMYYENQSEIIPGVKVPGIQTGHGVIPVVTTPYINDLDGGAGVDIARIYLLDLDSLEWHGVAPFGGTKTLDPQIFDITKYMNGQPLTEERMALIYGTLYLKNRGEGVYRIDVTCPSGTVWNI